MSGIQITGFVIVMMAVSFTLGVTFAVVVNSFLIAEREKSKKFMVVVGKNFNHRPFDD